MSPTTRQLAAIMFTDIVGYTALMGENSDKALELVHISKEIQKPLVEKHNGKWLKEMGDGAMSQFNSALDAVNCSVEIQEIARAKFDGKIRIGIHLGDITIENEDIYGDGVNVASRLESVADPGGIYISESIEKAIRGQSLVQTTFLGEIQLKNVDYGVRTFAIQGAGLPVPEGYDAKVSGETRQKEKIVKPQGTRILYVGIIATLLAIAIGQYLYSIYGKISDDPVTASKEIGKSIAVMPFDNYSNNPEQEYFANGIADEIRSQILAIADLKVISRSSSTFYKNKQLSLTELGEALDVGYVLEGSVQRSADIVKIGVQLSNTKTDKLEWAMQPLERKLEDIFKIQNEIAGKIVEQLKLSVSENVESRLIAIPTESMEAYDNYNKGQDLLHRSFGTLKELNKAIGFFEEAITLDPNFSKAYVGLADAYLEFNFWGRANIQETLRKASEAAFKALELDANIGEYYGTIGSIHFWRGEYKSSERYLNKAIELSPNYTPAYSKLAWIKMSQGKTEDSEILFDMVRKLDPASVKELVNFCYVYCYSREFEKAIKKLAEGNEMFPDNDVLKWAKGYVYSTQGEFEKSIEVLKNRNVGQNTNWMLGYAYGMSGRRSEAAEILEFQLEKRKTQHVPAFMIATIYMGLNNHEKALEWLERDYQEGAWLLFLGLKNDAKFDPIRGEKRFVELMKKIDASFTK